MDIRIKQYTCKIFTNFHITLISAMLSVLMYTYTKELIFHLSSMLQCTCIIKLQVILAQTSMLLEKQLWVRDLSEVLLRRDQSYPDLEPVTEAGHTTPSTTSQAVEDNLLRKQ